MNSSTTAARARNRRGEGARLREEIVQAAAELLEEAGHEQAVTLRAVARKVGIAAPSIYAHFADREEILLAVLEEAFLALDAALVASGEGLTDPVERLDAMGRAYIAFSQEQPHRYKVLFSREGLIPSTSFAAELKELPEDGTLGGQAFGRLVTVVQDCIDAGRSHSTDAWQDALAVWIAIHGYCSLRPATPGFPWGAGDDIVFTTTERLARIIR